MNNSNYDSPTLDNNEIWKSTYNIYINNEKIFKKIMQSIQRKYGLSAEMSKDAMLYEIMSCQYGNNRYYKKQSLIKWTLIYLGIFILIPFNIVISSIIYFIIKKKKAHLIYEEMWPINSLYDRFYNYIDEQIKSHSLKKAILFISPSFAFDTLSKVPKNYKNKIINRRFSNILFYHDFGIKIFVKDSFFIINLIIYSKKSDINYIYLYLRFIRKLLMYSSQSTKFKCDILISASDYYWNPVKYFMYKKSAKNIILIQHNYINEYLHLRLFQYCDYYYAHSHQSVEKHEFCGSAIFYSLGSFQLIPFLKAKKIEYDVLFVSQPVYDNLLHTDPFLDQQKLINSYNNLINNFYLFLRNNPNIKAIYVTKMGNIDNKPATEDIKILAPLSNIKFISTAGKETFNLISQSKLIINMYSSIGFESYGLNKRVLWINYNRCCDIFKYDTENEDIHVIINDIDYTSFEKRVNLLLSDNKEVDKHYAKLKEKYMNIQENPASVVADKIVELVGDI